MLPPISSAMSGAELKAYACARRSARTPNALTRANRPAKPTSGSVLAVFGRLVRPDVEPDVPTAVSELLGVDALGVGAGAGGADCGAAVALGCSVVGGCGDWVVDGAAVGCGCVDCASVEGDAGAGAGVVDCAAGVLCAGCVLCAAD